MSEGICTACRHEIDASARLCPYCGANPKTGQRVDTQALLTEVFHGKQLSTGETVLEFARNRQGIMIVLSAIALFLVLGAIHQYASLRNRSLGTAAPAVALSELTDVSSTDQQQQTPMPDLQFQVDGNPQAIRNPILEPGAVVPPAILAEQQAAAQELAQKQQASKPATPVKVGTPGSALMPAAQPAKVPPPPSRTPPAPPH